jgi:alpha-mannosidase
VTLHLLPNAHLDPVWLWDWREGLTEGITTVETILSLMDEFPEMTFIRGESVIYRHIQKTRPDVFRRIRKQIEVGRWDVVGGTLLQPDSNLASTETLCRLFEDGLRFFREELGVRPTIAWQADSFGHPAGWPNILENAGMEGFAFSRPGRREFPLESPAFWWQSRPQCSLLCYRQHWDWYGCERSNISQVLDSSLERATKQPLQNVAVLFGLGNHGGGPSRRHIVEISEWRRNHPEVDVRFSTLHGFFEVLRKELAAAPSTVPVVNGEFGHCLRGCYSSVQKFKSLYRQTEAEVVSVELTNALLVGEGGRDSIAEAWDAVLFNSFHDILPGTAIERAMAGQERWMGGAAHAADKVRFQALNALAARVDTTIPTAPEDRPNQVPVLIWNPLPRAFFGQVEIEVCLDYRPLFEFENRSADVPFGVWDEKNKLLPFQEIATEHSSLENLPWRKRAVVSLEIPPWGWRVVRAGLAVTKPSNQPARKAGNAISRKSGIANSAWEIDISKGGRLRIHHRNQSIFARGQALRLITVEDPWGAWGGMNEEPESYRLDQVRTRWTLVRHHVIEEGPERAAVWTRWEGGNSWLELTFELDRITPWVSVRGRLLWNERSARLQLVIPSQGDATCDVPGGIVIRAQRGQRPVGRWFLRKDSAGRPFGVASDVLSDADFLPTETRLTLARATRYANDVPTGPEEKPWQPAVDCGELQFRLRIFGQDADPDHAADSLLFPPHVQCVSPQSGDLPRTGTFGHITTSGIKVLSLQKLDGGRLRIRIQNRTGRSQSANIVTKQGRHSLGHLEAGEILSAELSNKLFIF